MNQEELMDDFRKNRKTRRTGGIAVGAKQNNSKMRKKQELFLWEIKKKWDGIVGGIEVGVKVNDGEMKFKQR